MGLKKEEFHLWCDGGPLFIAFQGNDGELGRLHLTDPLRFEGKADESARLFFKYVIDHNSSTLALARKLLEVARCPDERCDGRGTVAIQVAEDDWEPAQCQWCHDRYSFLNKPGV